MGKLLAIRNARLYFLGSCLSEIGDYALWLAASIWVKDLTGSTTEAGLCLACLAAGTLTSPLTGLVVDRVRRKPLILVVNSLTSLLVLTLTQVHRTGQVWVIFAVMFVYGTAAATVSSAMTSLLPSMVPADLLGTANGLSQALSQVQRLFTPALGVGLLVLYGGAAVAVLDAASFAAGTLCWAFTRVNETRPTQVRADWRHETAAGFAYLFNTPTLRQLTLALTAGIFVMGFFETLSIAISTTGLHHAASWTSVIVTVMSITGIIGGVLGGPVVKMVGPSRITSLGLAFCSASALLLAVPSDIVVLGGAMTLGLGVPLIVVGSLTALQLNTPNELLGRVTGADNFLVTGGQAMGIAVGAELISELYYRDLCYIAAGVLSLATAYLVTRRQTSAEVPLSKNQRPGRGSSAGSATT